MVSCLIISDLIFIKILFIKVIGKKDLNRAKGIKFKMIFNIQVILFKDYKQESVKSKLKILFMKEKSMIVLSKDLAIKF